MADASDLKSCFCQSELCSKNHQNRPYSLLITSILSFVINELTRLTFPALFASMHFYTLAWFCHFRGQKAYRKHTVKRIRSEVRWSDLQKAHSKNRIRSRVRCSELIVCFSKAHIVKSTKNDCRTEVSRAGGDRHRIPELLKELGGIIGFRGA